MPTITIKQLKIDFRMSVLGFFYFRQISTDFARKMLYTVYEVVVMNTLERERDKLERMIITNEKYSKILKQSQKLDKIIFQYYKG